MSALVQPVTVLLPVGYLLLALLYTLVFASEAAPRTEVLRRWVFRFVILAHVMGLVLRAEQVGRFPIDDTWTAVSAVALATAATYGSIARILKHLGSGGAVMGCVFVLQLLSSAFSDLRPDSGSEPQSASTIVHVTTSVLATSALILSGLHGSLYLLLFRQMRRRSFGVLFKYLPDLNVLTRLTRLSALAGFIFLTVGLNMGIFVAHRDQTAGFDYSDPAVILTLFLWLHFGVIAFSGKISALSARRASFAALAGLVALIFSLILILFPELSFHPS